MSSTDLHTSVVHVGEAPPDFPSDSWVSTTVYFHGFADLPHEKGSLVTSSEFHSLGHKWYLKLYPGGQKDSGDGEERISLYLRHCGDETINIEYRLDVRDFTCEAIASISKRFAGKLGYGCRNFLKRETALTCLVQGALVIEVMMKVESGGSTFVPSNPSAGLTFKRLFMDQESADVVFEIGGGAVETGNEMSTKKRMTSKTFYAHRCILMKMAPQLADLCSASQSQDDNCPFVVLLHNVPVHAFRALLRYIYGLKIIKVGKDIAHIKEILETADQFAVVNLKLEAEELLISSISLDVDNAIDHYVYAEDKNCAALKEKVVAFIVDHWDDIHASKRENDLPDNLRLCLMHDMMMATKIKDKPGDDGALHTMPIGKLRLKAHKKGLNVDGSRETLIALLK
jgi:hypothetical protein